MPPPAVSKPSQSAPLETSKPSALFKPRKGRDWTLSMAVAGSIIANVVKPDHKTLLAGRIARAAAVFCVDEIIVFDDDPTNIPNYIDPIYTNKGKKTKAQALDSIAEHDEPWQNPDQFLYHVLSYAECPPHLRADQNPGLSLFPQHQNLKWVGMLPSLDMPHHLKSHEWCRFREGVTLGPTSDARSTPSSKKSKDKSKQQPGTYVKCGLPYPVRIATEVPPVMRVTLRFTDPEPPKSWPHLSQQECEALKVEAVAPTVPRQEEGYYWGYQIRRAGSLSEVFTASEFKDGYDLSIGTSERGAPLKAILPDHLVSKQIKKTRDPNVAQLPSEFNHLLIVFGGVAGLEPAVAADPEFKRVGLTKETAHEAFDAWVNLVQGQGSRTIRTEEAVEFGLFGLKDYVESMYDRGT
ncbi:deoxyribose-phosphate aldolase 2 [Periconia macrospinosa]|uniref:Deoxyribose-phosphate aldolase 2 n=1 Tax=Periconia macrospinosa TaxID=97972 RepID=A0A2V1E8J6_9PLEO|nr:deoxyribose-phosphate aldolase 2 [Periconia macrospinosa]